MTKLSAFLFTTIIGFAAQNTTAQSFTFNIYSPVNNGPGDSSLSVAVHFLTSTYELSTITAVTEGRQTTLYHDGYAGAYYAYVGSINLAGLTEGST